MAGRCNPARSLLLALLTVAAVCALFLPFLGSYQGHHFTERLPRHGHLYLGGLPFEHLHPYEIPHLHGEAQDAPGSFDTPGSERGIVFLPPDEEGATGSSGLGVAAASLTMFIALLIPPILTQIFPIGQRAFRSIILPPEPPPPRPAL